MAAAEAVHVCALSHPSAVSPPFALSVGFLRSLCSPAYQPKNEICMKALNTIIIYIVIVTVWYSDCLFHVLFK